MGLRAHPGSASDNSSVATGPLHQRIGALILNTPAGYSISLLDSFSVSLNRRLANQRHDRSIQTSLIQPGIHSLEQRPVLVMFRCVAWLQMGHRS